MEKPMTHLSSRRIAGALLFVASLLFAASAGADPVSVMMYKNPQCGCCEEYAKYLRRQGFKVTVKPTHDMSLISRQHGVPEHLAGCHTTMLIGGYVVEGHVPVSAIKKLLAERPDIKGISLPGMPEGSPGMTGTKTGPFEIMEISDGPPKVFATE
jgi:hypothetical protein